jgi:hypothetical protein
MHRRSRNLSLAVVGSVALDDIDGPFGPQPALLGGSGSFFATAASYFTNRVSMIAVVGEDFPSEHVDFFDRQGIDLSGLVRRSGSTFRWAGRYSDDLSTRETLSTELGVFADFAPKLRDEHRRVDLLVLGNIDPDLQVDVLEHAERPGLVAADTMNFWIDGKRDALGRAPGRRTPSGRSVGPERTASGPGTKVGLWAGRSGPAGVRTAGSHQSTEQVTTRVGSRARRAVREPIRLPRTFALPFTRGTRAGG